MCMPKRAQCWYALEIDVWGLTLTALWASEDREVSRDILLLLFLDIPGQYLRLPSYVPSFAPPWSRLLPCLLIHFCLNF